MTTSQRVGDWSSGRVAARAEPLSGCVEQHANCRRESERPEDAEWDSFVASNTHGYHEQTSMYGRIRAAHGLRVDRVIVRDGSSIVGGAQVLVQSTPLGNYARVYRAPLAMNDDPSTLNLVVRELETMARQRRYASLRVDTFPTQSAARTALAEAGFHPSRAWFGELDSASVSLAMSDDEILHSLKPKTRYCIRVAERRGVTVRSGGAELLEEFYSLRKMTAEHAGYLIYPKDYYQYTLNLFAPRGKAWIHIAYLEGTPVGGLVTAEVANRMYFVWMGTHRGEQARKVNANYLLYIRAMSSARDHGCTHCDSMGTTEFTAKLLPEQIVWPLPQRKFYGPLTRLRRTAMECAWRSPHLRHRVNLLARRWGLKPRMPH